ncbi:MAG TPA: efflux transporter outer membrane subunit [Steroidobacteraceae bacterium]|nr:efflux transporter outer membrane subunit [Steroidobacteraceae bacterium]
MRCATNSARLVAAGLAFASLASCAVGPDFKRPAAPDSTGYQRPQPAATAATPAGAAADTHQQVELGKELAGAWWDLFHSPALDSALREALQHNGTLAAAQAALAQAHEAVVIARAGFLPRLNGTAGVQHSGGSTGRTVPSTESGPNLYSLGLSASYSVDVFGGTRRTVEQQLALEQIAHYQLAAAYLTLTGSVVTEALSIASTRLLIATTEDLLASDRKNLALTQREFEVGTAARADVLTADSQLAADMTQLPMLKEQLETARDAIAVLVGRQPEEPQTHEYGIEEFTVPREIPVRLPSQLVHQRPDILASEAQLHAASAAIGIAVAQEYPQVTLSAALTREALTAGGLFHNFETLWDAGAGLTAPIFAGGALRAQVRASRDAFAAQAATYRQVVLEGLGQVADDLWALQYDAERLSVYRHSLDIATEALKLQQASYAVGKSNVLQLIDAERTYAQARLGLATAQIQQFQDTAGLLVAVGGAWWQQPIDGTGCAPSHC